MRKPLTLFLRGVYVIALCGGTAGCTVGPNYKKPAVDVPPSFRGLAPEDANSNSATSRGDEKWWRFIKISNFKL